MMVTRANEVLAHDGIHGRIASVGRGFGTGRHTANAFYIKKNKSSEY